MSPASTKIDEIGSLQALTNATSYGKLIPQLITYEGYRNPAMITGFVPDPGTFEP